MNEHLHEIASRIDTTAEELVAFFDSPGGRRLRRWLATGLILSVPFVMRIPWLRRSPIGKIVEVTGGAALLIKAAELIRDWEHNPPPSPTVIDVPLAEA